MKKVQTQKNWLYMHTLSGQPADYIPGMQIVYATGKRGNAGVWHLTTSLKQISREQNASYVWRKNQGYNSLYNDYGYVRIARNALLSPPPSTQDLKR